MQSPPHDPASALAIRNQYRQSQSRALAAPHVFVCWSIPARS
ncbi:hypothetical protein ALP08_02626 [Pseudomonas syringae pv. pisi]|nr:hypothetical protein ALP08_02626 [Pseudomonas syringae pv. pisi]